MGLTNYIRFRRYAIPPLKTHQPMASQEAICRIRVKTSALHEEQTQSASHRDLISAQYNHTNNGARTLEEEPLLPLRDISGIALKTRLQWAKLVAEQVLSQRELDDDSRVRDWDFALSLDGSVENSADNAPPLSPSSPSAKAYPARYRIPNEIIERLSSNQEKVQRAELFALGGLLYHVLSGTEMMSDLDTSENVEHIQSCFVNGEFPETVWGLPYAVRILGCCCPGFAQDLLAARGNDEALLSRIAGYIKEHPVLFGLKVAGGIASLASVLALPILGAVGFGVAGPVAGSAAAAWQSGIGLVEAGSIFAWCQGAAMGGAAVNGIVATGIAGAGVVGAAGMAGAVAGAGAGADRAARLAALGAFDDIDTPAPALKEKFLSAWRRDIGIKEIATNPK